MMGVAEMAAAAVGLLSPYLAKGAEELAKAVGSEVGGRVVKLWDAVKTKLAGKEALADVEAKPDDQRRWSALEVQLEKALEADPAFRAELAALVEEIRAKGGDQIIQKAVASGGSKVGQIAGKGNVLQQ